MARVPQFLGADRRAQDAVCERGWTLGRLNTGTESLPSAPESVFYAAGFGGNYIYVDSENDLVIAVRWVGNTRTLDEIVQRVLISLE